MRSSEEEYCLGIHQLVDLANQGHDDYQVVVSQFFCIERIIYEFRSQVGKMLEEGIVLPKDGQLAVKYYSYAITTNHKVALGLYAEVHDKGIWVSKDEVKAFEYYSRAAALGNPASQVNLALCYETGKGVTKDLHAAFKWYEKAAEAGHPVGKYNLGTT